MNSSAIWNAAIRDLRRAPVRSVLTALGVIVGIASVVATAGIGNGARAKIEDVLSQPGSRVVYLMASVPLADWHLTPVKLPPADRLQPADYYQILETVPNIVSATPEVFLPSVQVTANGRAVDAMTEGLDIGGLLTSARLLLFGDLFNSFDVSRAANVCVLSEGLVRELRYGNAVGGSIRINGIPFTVIGVVDDISYQEISRPNAKDLHVYVPFTSLLRRLDPTAEMSISVQAQDIQSIDRVQQSISDVMESRRNGRKAEFQTTSAVASLKVYTQGSETMARLLAVIGAIALVVGGIGIMNIMLVSVTERTREIGIRMALGTRSRDVLWQFLFEAGTLSLLGGIAGAAIGIAACWFMGYLNGWPVHVTITSVIEAFVCAVVTGLFFGYQPARRASRLVPFEALRAQ